MARLNDTMSQQFQSSEIFIPLSPAEPQPCYLFGFILFLCFSSVNVSCIFPNVFFFLITEPQVTSLIHSNYALI